MTRYHRPTLHAATAAVLGVVAFGTAVLATVAASGHEHGTVKGVVGARMDGMMEMSRHLTAIQRRLRTKADLATVAGDADAIRRLGTEMPALFPPGSTQPPTEARPAIWRNFADFEDMAKALVREAGKLKDIPASDRQAISAQFAVMSDACTACHDKYRLKQ